MAARLVSLVSTIGTVRGCSTRSTARTIKPFPLNSLARSSTSEASSSQYLHQVVQNSKRTTLPLMESLLNCSPVVVLARKGGAGSPVSSPARAMSGESNMMTVKHAVSGRRFNMAQNITQAPGIACRILRVWEGTGRIEGRYGSGRDFQGRIRETARMLGA